MASRLLTQLAARIAAARDPVEAACLRAQRSVYLARQGKRDEADAVVKAIREEFGAAPNGEVTAWVSLAEALIHFYTQPGPQAMDRLRRAHALSRAMNHPVLLPLCEAWLAHMEFNANRMAPTLQHAQEALRLAKPEHHAALARVSLVIADAFHFAGRFDLAKDWYAAVRDHALAEGDDAMISAMLHNVATFRASNVRLKELFGEGNPSETTRAMMEVDSTKNYDAGIGTASLSWFVPLLRAQLLTVEREYRQALDLFSENIADAETQGLGRLLVSFLADSAWCKLQLGMVDEARIEVERCIASSNVGCDSDDLAGAYARASVIFSALGEAARSERYRELSEDAWKEHCAAQSDLLERLLLAIPESKRASG